MIQMYCAEMLDATDEQKFRWISTATAKSPFWTPPRCNATSRNTFILSNHSTKNRSLGSNPKTAVFSLSVIAKQRISLYSYPSDVSQAQQDTTETEKVRNFFRVYTSQILSGVIALFLLYTNVYSKKGCPIGEYGCAPSLTSGNKRSKTVQTVLMDKTFSPFLNK